MSWVRQSMLAIAVLSAGVTLVGVPQAAAAAQEQGAVRSRRDVVVVPQIEFGREGRARLGVRLADLDEASARAHKLAAPEGALVKRVEPDSPAAKGGIKADDVITAFDGERVRSVRHLQRLVADTPVARAVKVVLTRDGRKVETTIKPDETEGLGEVAGDLPLGLERDLRDLPRAYRFHWDSDRDAEEVTPDEPSAGQAEPFMRRWRSESGSTGRLGILAQGLTPQLAEFFGAKEQDGVLVAAVTDGSPAARAGVKAGDVITSVDGKPVKDPASLAQMVRQRQAGPVSLGILRDHKAQTLEVTLAAARGGEPI